MMRLLLIEEYIAVHAIFQHAKNLTFCSGELLRSRANNTPNAQRTDKRVENKRMIDTSFQQKRESSMHKYKALVTAYHNMCVFVQKK